MKRLMTAVCCACALGAVGASAAQDKMMDKKMDKSMKSMTMTGCVAEKDGHYMLNNAMMNGEMKGDMKGEMKPMSYGLMGGDLKAHVGHKVEVTGMMDSKMVGTTGTMDHDKMDHDKMMDKDKMAMSDMHGTINVKSVKMMSPTCP